MSLAHDLSLDLSASSPSRYYCITNASSRNCSWLLHTNCCRFIHNCYRLTHIITVIHRYITGIDWYIIVHDWYIIKLFIDWYIVKTYVILTSLWYHNMFDSPETKNQKLIMLWIHIRFNFNGCKFFTIVLKYAHDLPSIQLPHAIYSFNVNFNHTFSMK